MHYLYCNLFIPEILKMGVFGLTTYYTNNKELVSEKYDLVEEASKDWEALEIVVDYISFIIELTIKSVELEQDGYTSRSLASSCGNYDIFKTLVSNIITKLRKCGIELVFFNDGAYGSDKANFARKFETVKGRYQSNIEVLTHIQDYCRGHAASRGALVVPPLTSKQMQYIIKELDCKMFHTPGEADLAIAKYLVENEKAFAVLGNDSDFCVLKGCRFIPDVWFDLNHDLDSEGDLEHLEVRVITPERVAAALKVCLLLTIKLYFERIKIFLSLCMSFGDGVTVFQPVEHRIAY